MRVRGGFSIVEVLVLVSIVALVIFVFMRPAGRNADRRQRIACVNNLKNIGLAARIAQQDMSGSSMTTPTNLVSFFQLPSFPAANPRLFNCPADKTGFPALVATNLAATNISYFVNPALSATDLFDFLAGDNHLHLGDAKRISGALTIRSNTPLAWSADRHFTEQRAPMGQVAMGDGSVQQFDQPALQAAVSKLGASTNVLLFP